MRIVTKPSVLQGEKARLQQEGAEAAPAHLWHWGLLTSLGGAGAAGGAWECRTRVTQHRDELHSSTDAHCSPRASLFQCLQGNRILTSFPAPQINPTAPACPSSQCPPRAHLEVSPAREPGGHLSRKRSCTFLSSFCSSPGL